MRKVNPAERLGGFGLCFICETFMDPSAPDFAAVDTDREFDPNYQHPLAGHKFVCRSCGEQIGLALGMVRERDLAEATLAIEASRVQMSALKSFLKGFNDSASDVIDALSDLPAMNISSVIVEEYQKEKEKEAANG